MLRAPFVLGLGSWHCCWGLGEVVRLGEPTDGDEGPQEKPGSGYMLGGTGGDGPNEPGKQVMGLRGCCRAVGGPPKKVPEGKLSMRAPLPAAFLRVQLQRPRQDTPPPAPGRMAMAYPARAREGGREGGRGLTGVGGRAGRGPDPRTPCRPPAEQEGAWLGAPARLRRPRA